MDDSPDEFEQIKETFTQGLEEAKSTLNGWVSNIAKRFEGNNDGNNPNKEMTIQNYLVPLVGHHSMITSVKLIDLMKIQKFLVLISTMGLDYKITTTMVHHYLTDRRVNFNQILPL